MQPYFFPYIGYFQLIRAADLFVIYDNIQYSKRGWINRNRILRQGQEALISIALKKDSDFLDVRDRELAANFDRDKLLKQIADAYHKAPYFRPAFPVIEAAIRHADANLFRFLHHSIITVCAYLHIDTSIAISSHIAIDHESKGQDKVLAICQQVAASDYINPIGGTALYSRAEFSRRKIRLSFLRSIPFDYPQMGNPFIPSLSIVDVMMFNSRAHISRHLESSYEIS